MVFTKLYKHLGNLDDAKQDAETSKLLDPNNSYVYFTLAGIAASIVVAVIGWAVGWFGSLGILWCAIAAFIATNLESLIGATLQEQLNWLTNEVVNFINTLIGAIVAMVLAATLAV